MTPFITLRQRVIAWLLWHFEGYKTMNEAYFSIMFHPDTTKVASLMRDYWYTRKATEVDA